MNVCVVGLGHFATVVATVLASDGHTVMQADEVPPLKREGQLTAEKEPRCVELATAALASGHWVQEMPSVDVYWFAYDVPLDANGAPVTDEVERRIVNRHESTEKHIPFLVSCQWPVGTTRRVSKQCKGRELLYVMENVRVGKAISDFRERPFPLIGVGDGVPSARATRLADMYKPLIPTLLTWESAEMAKHATNAFMALQVSFANEIADVCESVGANPHYVMEAVMSDARVSDKAPLWPGAPFGGGSLQRDLMVLETLTDGQIIHAIRKSNDSRS